jgi:uncharacterized protein (TIRG00374 family)
VLDERTITDMTTGDADSKQGGTKKSKFGAKQWIATILTLIIVVLVFAVVFPKLGDYSQAWTAIQGMSIWWIITLVLGTVAVVVFYAWPFQAALPGLKYHPAFVTRQTSFMISNVVPAGGAIGLGVQYGMLNSYGAAPAASTAAIGITSVWNTFITLSLPILALIGLLFIGKGTTEAAIITLIGAVVVVAAIIAFAYILRSEASARKLGDWTNSVVQWGAGLIHKEVTMHLGDALVSFRASIVGVVSERWKLITGTNFLQQISQFSILLIAILALEGMGGQINLIEAFAAFAFARLATFIPIPPGGLGTTDAIMTGVLTAFGMDANNAMAAVLIWRALTYFPQVLIGLGSLFVWHRDQRKKAQAAT